MEEDIQYQINGLLVDNTVTVDNTEDRRLVAVSNGSADEARIIAEMRAEASGLREETILHVLALEKRIIKRLLMSGITVNNGLYRANASFRGIIENGVWNADKNSIAVNFRPGADLREAMEKTHVNILGEKSSPLYIGGTTDAATRARDATATAGRAFILKGRKLKITGEDRSVGITLTPAEGGITTKVTQDLFVTNGPSKVSFIIPHTLPDGAYQLRLTTQYGSNSKNILKTPRSVEKTIYIGTTPPSGGGEDEPTHTVG